MRLVLLVFLAACDADPADDTDTARPDTSDSDDTEDSEDTDDTDDTEDTEEPVTPHDCLDNHGIFGPGSRWDYAWKNSNRTGARSITVAAYDNATNTATLKRQDTWTDAAATFSETRVTWYECDAVYLYVVSRTVDSTFDPGIGDVTVTADTYTYDAPVPVQVNHTNDAPTPTIWTRKTKGTRVGKDGASTPFDSSVMCWLVQADVLGYSPYTPDHYQCGSPPTGPGTEPEIVDEYRWEEGIGIVNDWDSRLTSHSE